MPRKAAGSTRRNAPSRQQDADDHDHRRGEEEQLSAHTRPPDLFLDDLGVGSGLRIDAQEIEPGRTARQIKALLAGMMNLQHKLAGFISQV